MSTLVALEVLVAPPLAAPPPTELPWTFEAPPLLEEPAMLDTPPDAELAAFVPPTPVSDDDAPLPTPRRVISFVVLRKWSMLYSNWKACEGAFSLQKRL